EADASCAWAPAETPATRKLESTDKISNERDSLCMQSTPKLERKTPNPGPERIARAPCNGIDHGVKQFRQQSRRDGSCFAYRQPGPWPPNLGACRSRSAAHESSAIKPGN